MKTPRRARTLIPLALFGGMLLSTTLAAEPPRGGPAADAVVALELRIADEEPFRLSLATGQAGTIRSPWIDGTWVIVPVAIDRASDEVTLRVSKAVGTRADGLVVGEPVDVSLYRDFRQPLAYLPIDVRVLGVHRFAPERRNPSRVRGLDLDRMSSKDGIFLPVDVVSTGSDCCVSCGRTTICGCEVNLSCGYCCSYCCGPIAK